VELASNATSSADMYFVIAGITSARAAASRKPLALAIALSTRSPPKIVASTSGTSTIAKTFDPTGQLLSAQAGGRFFFFGAATAAGAFGPPGGTAATGGAGRVNMVTGRRPGERPQG
jgi:hypothetical protein